jgi:hypothetical protein
MVAAVNLELPDTLGVIGHALSLVVVFNVSSCRLALCYQPTMVSAHTAINIAYITKNTVTYLVFLSLPVKMPN